MHNVCVSSTVCIEDIYANFDIDPVYVNECRCPQFIKNKTNKNVCWRGILVLKCKKCNICYERLFMVKSLTMTVCIVYRGF